MFYDKILSGSYCVKGIEEDESMVKSRYNNELIMGNMYTERNLSGVSNATKRQARKIELRKAALSKKYFQSCLLLGRSYDSFEDKLYTELFVCRS